MPRLRLCVLVTTSITLGSTVSPAVGQETFKTPPEIVRTVLDAPRLPTVVASPNGDFVALAEPAPMPTIADLAAPMLRLAGVRIDPRANTRHTVRWVRGIVVRDVPGGAARRLPIPDGARLSQPTWSPDGRALSFTNASAEGLALWVADPEGGTARAVTAPILNGVMGQPCAWMPDSRSLLCSFVPEGRGSVPVERAVPSGPIVQRTSGPAAPARTYQDLLTSPLDERLFEFYGTGQLAVVDALSGTRRDVGQPGIFLNATPSPGGDALLVEVVRKPFSYVVPVRRFAHDVEIWDLSGRLLHTVEQAPLAEQVPVGGVPTGRRNVQWVPGGGDATLAFVEALDGGHTRRAAEVRDRFAILAPPYTAPVVLTDLGFRYSGVSWGRAGIALVSEYHRNTRHTRTWLIDTRHPETDPRLLLDRSREDRYGDPGTPVMVRDAAGKLVLLQSRDGNSVFMRGPGASPQGDRPFLDRFDLRTGAAERLWQSGDGVYASVAAVLDAEGRSVVVRRESPTTPPNYYLDDLRSGSTVPLTDLSNPAPALASVRRELVTYQRADGVSLSGTLYYPTDYRDGERVPVIFWIYPREYASAELAGQVRGSPNRFVLPQGASSLFLLTQGYAVLDNPTLPVIGEGDEANDSYQQQTVAGAEAAVRYLTERGVANGRFGVGGHSYGAFATANLLGHSDLFKAGVARSGAYNRTLTPFGFQSEQRTFWEAPELYLEMMPFSSAPNINEPILLIHGMADNNSGTFPIQSARMYHALKGHGATVEYVQLPFESHGYRARESVMDVIARTIEWFDRYVKEEAPPTSGG